MTYEEFKKELYRNILLQAEGKDKRIKLYERKTICSEMQDLQIIKALNVSCFGTADILIHEDVICALWERQGRLNMIHWKLRPLYERYKKEGWQSVLPEILVRLEQVGKGSSQLFAENASYEECSDKLILRPINYRRHRRELDNCIYWRYGDIALVLYGLLCDEGNDYVTIKIHRDMTAGWEQPDTRLLTNALLNSYEKMPPRLFKAGDFETKPDVSKGIFIPEEKASSLPINPSDRWEGLRGYRLTTVRQLNGALAMFYPGVRKRLAEIMGGDYYVGFTSIHEAVIHPVRFKNPNDMKEAIQHINAVFDEQEMLTNRVYRYSCKREELLEV